MKADMRSHAEAWERGNGQIDELSLAGIREATNKAWVLGSERFKQQIAQRLNRRAERLAKGGDRKSQAYRAGINRV
jgi:putative transposase